MQTLNGYKLTSDDVHLNDVHIKCAGTTGITGSMKGGYIDGFTLTNAIVSGAQDTPADNPENEKWGARLFNIRDALVKNVHVRNIEKEHGFYVGRAGNMRYERCLFTDIGSQGIQDAQREIDSIEGRLANVPCVLEVIDCKFERCATPLGARQSWNLTVFGFDENLRQWYPDGPLILTPQGKPQKGHFVRSLTDLVVVGIQCIGNGYPHIASGNRDCDSTGGILVGDRENFDLRRWVMNFTRPDRESIQIRNVANAWVGAGELNGGNIVLHDMDACHVTIQPGIGDGEIRRRAPGAHTTTFLSKITAGYSH